MQIVSDKNNTLLLFDKWKKKYFERWLSYKLAQRTARLIENHTLIRCFVSYLLQLSIEQIQRTRTLFLLNSITRSSTELNVQFL